MAFGRVLYTPFYLHAPRCARTRGGFFALVDNVLDNCRGSYACHSDDCLRVSELLLCGSEGERV